MSLLPLLIGACGGLFDGKVLVHSAYAYFDDNLLLFFLMDLKMAMELLAVVSGNGIDLKPINGLPLLIHH